MDRKQRQKHERLARSLRYLLGTAPDEFGLVLDPEGWIDLKSLVVALQENPETRGVNASRILDLQWALEDLPFEFEEKRIRIHPDSGCVPPIRETLPPPLILYYGCRRKPYPVYREKGIHPTDGREIVLSREREMALRIACRRDPKPILIEVNTELAANRGTRFQAYGESLFLADFLPQESLFGPPVKEENVPSKRRRQTGTKDIQTHIPAAPSPDSFLSQPWDPGSDRLLLRDLDIETEKKVRRERGKKKVGWKEDLRKRKRKRTRD